MTDHLWTVETAAEHLRLHPKTILRFIREGRLRATKVGKQYRIRRKDLDALTGAESGPSTAARATVVVDVLDVGQDLLQRLTSTLLGAAAATRYRPETLSVDVAHDPVRRTAKVITVGTPAAAAEILQLVAACIEG